MYSLRFRDELPEIVARELDAFLGKLKGFLLKEHNEDGTHLDASPESALVPVGGIIPWPTNTAPDRWLFCDGSAVSRLTYKPLFITIGTQYGAGDGVLTFNVPNLQSRFPRGRGSSDTIGGTGGAATHTHSISSGGAHTHTATTSSDGAHAHSMGNHRHAINEGSPDLAAGDGDDSIPVYPSTDSDLTDADDTGSAGAHTHTLTTDSQGAHDHGGATGSGSTLPPYVNLNYIIFAGG